MNWFDLLKNDRIFVKGKYAEVFADKTDIHCVECGLKTVYVEFGDGDYYAGPDYFCISCKNVFTLQNGGINESLEFEEIGH